MTIYAISIATNLNRADNTKLALQSLQQLGECQVSAIYEIPCRDGIGEDYWNCACLLHSRLQVDAVVAHLKQLESDTGRKRPSHKISLDMDLIAWGESLSEMVFNPKKLPLANDVIIPMLDIWSLQQTHIDHQFKIFNTTEI